MKIKNYFIGLYVLFLPVLLFLDISNLRQISEKSLLIIILSIIIVFFIILILCKVYQLIFKLPLENNIFPGLCFVFYFQFYYAEIKSVFRNNLINSGYIIIIFLIILSISTIILWSKHFKILNKFSVIFSILISITFFYNFYIFTTSTTENFEIKNNKSNKNVISINEQKKFNNIYFIIFDAMMPLENFKKDTIYSDGLDFDINNVMSQFNVNFKYLNGSVSNYNNTKLSVSSIFYNKYFLDPKSEKFKNYNNFFPYFFYDQNKVNKLDLLNILKEKGVKFTWFSNSTMPCKNIRGIICGSSSNFETDILNEFKIFYSKTPILAVLNKLTSSLDKEIPSDDLLDYIKNIKTIENKNNFFFVHNMIPNGGSISYDYDCNITEKTNEMAVNYSNRYLCSIKKISELTELISKHDENALILITADHGVSSQYLKYESRILDNLTDNKPAYDPRIFTLIKFPKKCSNISPKSYDTLNLVRYLLNCNYSQNLDYLPYSHFRTYGESSKNFGKVFDVTISVKKYLNKITK